MKGSASKKTLGQVRDLPSMYSNQSTKESKTHLHKKSKDGHNSSIPLLNKNTYKNYTEQSLSKFKRNGNGGIFIKNKKTDKLEETIEM